ncbi:MAG: CHAT domain-containing protein [Paucibacter sp.]|nr:CHAT domain-containing protein [Roseateles sp.]
MAACSICVGVRLMARAFALCLVLVAGMVQAAPPAFEQTLAEGVALRQLGSLNASIEQLNRAAAQAVEDRERMRAAGELGTSLLQSRRLDDARIQLRKAYGMAAGPERAGYALMLGNLAMVLKQEREARQDYEEVRALVGPVPSFLGLSADLNLVRMAPPEEQLPALRGLSELLAKAGKLTDAELAALSLNLAHQAQGLGSEGRALAYPNLQRARSLAPKPGRLQVEALDALARLYEDEARPHDSLALNAQALEQAQQQPIGSVGEPMIALEWRAARLHTALGDPVLALAAWRRVVDRLEALRADIPIDFEDGGSSFRQLFEPVYMGLADGLIKASDGRSGAAHDALLREAMQVVEMIKQSEMQDYLGDRCTVDEVKGGTATVIPPGTAIVYPLIFAERLELLVMTRAGPSRFTEPVPGAELRRTAAQFADQLRNLNPGYIWNARKLYKHLLLPLEGLVAEQSIDTLVVVPDGALRLVPMAALHDGKRFAIERYAVVTAAGLSMTNTSRPAARGAAGALLAGASQFGSAVDRLLQTSQGRELIASVEPERALNTAGDDKPLSTEARSVQERALRESLALPGVTREIDELGSMLPGASRMLDAAFTVGNFREAAASGRYSFVHIASHGIFGGDARSSFLLAYDDLLTLGGLQELLLADRVRQHPLELLTLSACETAEGNERAPLGISGAAIKARAKSVLGTLWPVNDDAAVRLMVRFYAGLAGPDQPTKAQALRQAQRELLADKAFAHPFFWAPFSLIGNWL